MTTDAVHMLVDRIKRAWRKGKVVSILLLDVEGTFSNAVTDRLLHNLCKRRILEAYVKIIQQVLVDCCTKLKFDNFVLDNILINDGIGQGDPLSMVLYILYNADLLEIALTSETLTPIFLPIQPTGQKRPSHCGDLLKPNSII